MNGGVNPSTTLRKKNTPSVRSNCVGDSVGSEFHLELREVLHHNGGKISVLAELEKVLLVESVHVALSILFNDPIRNNEGTPFIGRPDAVHREASGQASD